MKKITLFTVSVSTAAMLLSACGEDKPGDKLAADTVHKIADREVHPGLAVTDFIRENGWIDNQTPNRYNVRFNYNLTLTQPYAEVVLNNAKAIEKERQQNSKTAGKGLFDVNAMQNGLEAMQQSMAITQWINNQGENFRPRYEKMIGNCAPCNSFIYDPALSKNEQNARFQTYVSSWGFFEELGFKDDMAVGKKVARQAWSAFMKTEKGWLPTT